MEAVLGSDRVDAVECGEGNVPFQGGWGVAIGSEFDERFIGDSNTAIFLVNKNLFAGQFSCDDTPEGFGFSSGAQSFWVLVRVDVVSS